LRDRWASRPSATRVRPYRRIPRDLLGRQVPHGQTTWLRVRSDRGPWAYGHHRRLNPPKASILRAGDHHTLRPGHASGPISRGAYQGSRRRCVVMRLTGLRASSRFQAPTGAVRASTYDKSVPPPGTGDRASDCAPCIRDGRAVLFVSPSFLRQNRRPRRPRERGDARSALEHVVAPRVHRAVKWEAGDIAMWDNRATSHLAADRHFDSTRSPALRITLVGDVRGGGRCPLGWIKGAYWQVETELTAQPAESSESV